MAWPKGKKKPKTGGRRKGTPNSAPTMREMLEKSLAAQNGGGLGYLTRLAQDEPKAYATLLGKLLPTELAGKVDIPTTIKVITGFEEGPPES